MKGIHIKHISLLFLVFFVTLTAFSQTTNFYRTSEKEQKKEKKKKSHHVKIPKSTEISILNAQSRPDRPGGSPVPPVLQSRRIYLSEGKTGIDISHYQGRINWEEVARDPQVTFVILKATESSDFVDNTYQYNIREARRHGLKVGSYHFYRAHVDPELQFRNMMRNIDPRQQDILPVIDVELTNGVSHDLFVNRLERLCDMVTKAYGAHPIIYTGKNLFAKYFNNLRWRHYKFWIAAYTSKQPELAGVQDYIMWQFTDKSRVQGIRGGVDMSRFVFGHTIDDILYRR